MHANPSVSSIDGELLSFNLSPKGVPEGIILRPADQTDVERLIQINFSPELAGQVTAIAREGDSISVECVPFMDAEEDAHPVFDLLRLITRDGQTLTAEGAPEIDVKVKGVAVRINYARRGEPNGGILNTGDFVHLRPHGAKAIGLQIGLEIEAEGEVRSGWSGHRVIEAHIANGISIEKPKKPKHGHREHHRHEGHQSHRPGKRLKHVKRHPHHA